MTKQDKMTKERLMALAFAASLSMPTRAAIATGTIGQRRSDSEMTEDAKLAQVIEGPADGGIAREVVMMQQARASGITWTDVPLDPAESGLTDPSITLDDSQIAALKLLTQNKYTILLGAAGTGKTSIVKEMIQKFIYGDKDMQAKGIRILEGRQGPSIATTAFTGKATSVLRENLPRWFHPSVKTIHGLLEYAPATNSDDAQMFYPTRHKENPLGHDILIGDEFSMVGMNLWHNMLDACTENTHIVLIGDLNQLVPVADAPFFAHVLAAALDDSHEWKVAELTTVHRQKGIGGQRILDAAYSVLDGKMPEFDKIEEGKPWRVAGIQLPPNSEDAHKLIVKTMYGLSKIYPTLEDGTKDTRPIYDPYSDLILTAGNGDEEGQKGAAVQQAPINESLSRLLLPDNPEHPTYVIDAGIQVRQFTVGDRVVCRSNEPPGTTDRITNGSLGKVIAIEWNKTWSGDRHRFGTKTEVLAWQLQKVAELRGKADSGPMFDQMGDALNAMNSMDMDDVQPIEKKKARPSSHNVTVEYSHGVTRTYNTVNGVASIQLAYAITTHTAQGSQAETVFIVVHSSVKHQLSVEWLYTGITRAKQRLVIFYNDLGLRTACSRRQIPGKTLAEKIKRYKEMVDKGDKLVRFYPD